MSWITSKLQAEDVPILLKLGEAGRLRDAVDWVYRKRRGTAAIVQALPAGSDERDWQKRPLFYMGLKLGGRAALTPGGEYQVFKGLNVFPGGLRGEPIGQWSKTSPTLDLKIYRYLDFFDPDRLFVSREIAQLPTISPVPPGAAFNNTVILIQMRERFPLNGWVLARPVMFAAATCLRATIIEDLVCHWYPKNLGSLPIPTEMAPELLVSLQDATTKLVDADENLANQWRHVEAVVASANSVTLAQLIAAGSPLAEGLVLPIASDDVVPDDVRLDGTGLHGTDFDFVVPHEDLRAVLWYLVHRIQQEKDEVPVQVLHTLKVPDDPSRAAVLIRQVLTSDTADEFEQARQQLDLVAASALGLTDDELSYIQERFLSDPFLSQLQPMWSHRGIHVQGYHDHSGGDRFSG